MASLPPGFGVKAVFAPPIAVGAATFPAELAAVALPAAAEPVAAVGWAAAEAAVAALVAAGAAVVGAAALGAAALGAVVAAAGFGVSVAVLPLPQAARIAAAALAPKLAKNARRVTRYDDWPASVFLIDLSLGRKRTNNS